MTREVYIYELGRFTVDRLFLERYGKFIRNGPYIFVTSSNITHAKGAELLRLDGPVIHDAGYLEAYGSTVPTLEVRDWADTLGIAVTGYQRDETVELLKDLLRGVRINGTEILVWQPYR